MTEPSCVGAVASLLLYQRATARFASLCHVGLCVLVNNKWIDHSLAYLFAAPSETELSRRDGRCLQDDSRSLLSLDACTLPTTYDNLHSYLGRREVRS